MYSKVPTSHSGARILSCLCAPFRALRPCLGGHPNGFSPIPRLLRRLRFKFAPHHKLQEMPRSNYSLVLGARGPRRSPAQRVRWGKDTRPQAGVSERNRRKAAALSAEMAQWSERIFADRRKQAVRNLCRRGRQADCWRVPRFVGNPTTDIISNTNLSTTLFPKTGVLRGEAPKCPFAYFSGMGKVGPRRVETRPSPVRRTGKPHPRRGPTAGFSDAICYPFTKINCRRDIHGTHHSARLLYL